MLDNQGWDEFFQKVTNSDRDQMTFNEFSEYLTNLKEEAVDGNDANILSFNRSSQFDALGDLQPRRCKY